MGRHRGVFYFSFLAALCFATPLFSAELQPSFPNYAIKLLPSAEHSAVTPPPAATTTGKSKLKNGGLLSVWYYGINHQYAGSTAGSGEESDNDSFRIRRTELKFTMDIHENIHAAAARGSPIGPVDPGLPFSWNQTVVLHEGTTILRTLRGFDPDFQPVTFNLPNLTGQNVQITSFAPNTGLLQATVLLNSAGTIETFPFQISARGITDNQTYNLIFDIRASNSRTRLTPFLTRSPGAIIKPGQIVRYSWTQTTRTEKRPKCEAVLDGRTGPATGLSQSFLTEVLGVKVQPFVLGHYLMTVTPRDVRGEPPRGSISNGEVFRCAFGSENLPPATDGMAADTFSPAVGQVITLAPVATDPETGRTVFDNQLYEFGDGSVLSGVSGSTTHSYAEPGIYRVRCTMTDDQGLAATAEDSVIVGATVVPKLSFNFTKNIVPEEGGIGLLAEDTLATTFKQVNAKPGDRIVFLYNRNQFGRLNASDPADDTDIVLAHGNFTGKTRLAQHVAVSASGGSMSISIGNAQFDRTGDPRFNRAETKGVFRNQRIAVCVVPADGSPRRVLAYLGNMQIKVKGGATNSNKFDPEDSVRGTATTKEPDPNKQEAF